MWEGIFVFSSDENLKTLSSFFVGSNRETHSYFKVLKYYNLVIATHKKREFFLPSLKFCCRKSKQKLAKISRKTFEFLRTIEKKGAFKNSWFCFGRRMKTCFVWFSRLIKTFDGLFYAHSNKL